MELKELFDQKLVFFDLDLNSKQEVISFLSNKLIENKFINSKSEFEKEIYNRENQGTTCIGDGIAIPHILNSCVIQSSICFIRLKNSIDWNIEDNQKVNLIFLISTNGVNSNDHLDALANLSKVLLKKENQLQFKKVLNFDSFNQILNSLEKNNSVVNSNSSYEVVCITACVTGIAHTYMAKEKMEEYAQQLNLSIKVETQGRRGVENKLSKSDIENAKVIILAHDKAIEGLSRLNNKKVIDVGTKEAIFKGKELIQKYLRNENLVEIKVSSKNDTVSEFSMKKFLTIKNNLLGGISRMLPFVVAGGIILGIAFLIDFASGNGGAKGNFGTVNPVAGWFAAIGKTSISMMVPILGAFIAFSIVGAQGLMPGMVAGLFSTNIMNFAYGYDGNGNPIKEGWAGLWSRLIPKNLQGSESGFVGAIVGGYLAALLVVGWSKALYKLPKGLHGARDIVFIPILSLISISLTMFVLNIPLGFAMGGISLGIQKIAELKLLWLVSILIGFMMCIDMGGPINKIAYSLGNLAIAGKLVTNQNTNAYNEQTIIMASSMLSGMLPPLMVVISTVIFPKVWTSKDRDAAKANWLMGACFVSEGAIPFMIKDPKRVGVSAMIGGAIIGGLVGALKIKLLASHGGIFVFPLLSSIYLENDNVMTGQSIALGAIGGLLILLLVSLLSAFILGIWRLTDIKRGALILESTNGVKESLNSKMEMIKNNNKIKNKDQKINCLKIKLDKYNQYENDLVIKQQKYKEILDNKKNKKRLK